MHTRTHITQSNNFPALQSPLHHLFKNRSATSLQYLRKSGLTELGAHYKNLRLPPSGGRLGVQPVIKRALTSEQQTSGANFKSPQS